MEENELLPIEISMHGNVKFFGLICQISSLQHNVTLVLQKVQPPQNA